MHRAFLVAILVAVGLRPTPSNAQAPPAVTEGPRRAVFETLADSQWVRLAAPGLGRREGRLLERGDSVLVLSPEPLRIHATSIDTLWTRTSSPWTGALIGALIGGTAGVLAGMSCKPEHDCDQSQAIGLFGATGAGAGGLLGLTVGALSQRWKRRFP